MGKRKIEVNLERRNKLKKFMTFSIVVLGSIIFARFAGLNRVLAGVVGDMKDDEIENLRKKRDKEIKQAKKSHEQLPTEKLKSIRRKYSEKINDVVNDKKIKVSRLLGV